MGIYLCFNSEEGLEFMEFQIPYYVIGEMPEESPSSRDYTAIGTPDMI